MRGQYCKGGRPYRLHVKLTSDEKALFNRVAAERGLTVAATLRALMILADGGRAPMIRLDQLSAADTLVELRDELV